MNLTLILICLQEAHSGFPFIRVPKVFPHLTGKRVLTMEWVVGENPNDLVLVSTRVKDDSWPAYSEQQRLEAKQRLLDLVSHFKSLCYFLFFFFWVRNFLLPVSISEFMWNCGACNVFHFAGDTLCCVKL